MGWGWDGAARELGWNCNGLGMELVWSWDGGMEMGWPWDMKANLNPKAKIMRRAILNRKSKLIGQAN